MGRQKKPKTSTIRVHKDVAELVQALAGIFRKDAPEFASDILRPVLIDKEKEAAKMLAEKTNLRLPRK